MSFAEDIAQKRADNAKLQQEQQSKAALLATASNTETGAKSGDIDALIAQVKEVQLATMLGNNKPHVILTDQTDLGDKMEALATKLADTVKQLDSGENDTAQLAQLKALTTALNTFIKSEADDDVTERKASADLLKAIKAIKLSPVVNVPAPNVTVSPSKLDLKPLQDTLVNLLSKQEDQEEPSNQFDLDDYKAQDIDNSVKDYQYIGFLNAAGNWYIIENDVKGNKLRFVFGTDNYSDAFARSPEFQYLLLNEAIDAIST